MAYRGTRHVRAVIQRRLPLRAVIADTPSGKAFTGRHWGKDTGAPLLVHLLRCNLLCLSRNATMSADQEFLLPTEPKEEVSIQPREPLWFKKSALLHIALVIVYTTGSVLAIGWTKAHDQPRPHDANCKLNPLTVHPRADKPAQRPPTR